MAFACDKCIQYRDYIFWYSLGIVIYFVDSSTLESLWGFHLELSKALRFNLCTLVCADVISSVLCLLTECNNLPSYVQIKIIIICDVL